MADEPNDAQHTAKKFLEDAREQIRPRLEGLVAHTAEAARQLAADMGEAPTPDNRRYWGTMGNFLTFGGQRLNSGSPELHALHAAKRRGHDPRAARDRATHNRAGQRGAARGVACPPRRTASGACRPGRGDPPPEGDNRVPQAIRGAERGRDVVMTATLIAANVAGAV